MPADAGDDASQSEGENSSWGGEERSSSEGDAWASSGRDADAQSADPATEAPLGGFGDGSSAGDEADEQWTEDEEEPSLAGVFGARPEDAPPRPEIVPETPSLENVAFLLLGVAVGLFVIWRAVAVFAP